MNRDVENKKTIYRIEFLTSKQAADYLGISTSRLFNMVSMGQIPYYKFQRSNRYSLEELRQLLQREPRGIRNGD